MPDDITPTPSTRGGSRPGAGRPAGAKDKTPRGSRPDSKSAWTVQVRVDEALEMRLKEEAAARGISPAALARECIEKVLSGFYHN